MSYRPAGWSRCVEWALHLYPTAFRLRFGPAMVDAFAERLTARRRSAGPWRAQLFAFGAVADVAWHGFRERRLVRRRDTVGRHLMGDLMFTLLQDVRFAIRLFAQARGFTLVAALVLALGIGSTTAVFGVINTLLVKTRPGQAEEVLGVFGRDRVRPDNYSAVSYPAFADLRARDGLFASIAGQNFGLVGLTEGDVTRRVFAGIVTAGFFDTFGVQPALGRGFSLDEERPYADIPVAVISHGFWKRLGGTPAVIGSGITLNTRVFTVVGVTPAGFTGAMALMGPDVWVPTGMFDLVAAIGQVGARRFDDRQNGTLMVMARLHDGATISSVSAPLDAAARDLERAYPVAHENLEFHLATLPRLSASTRPGDDGPVAGAMIVLLAMAAVVMLISALNVANMLLARVDTRRKELAIRLAIGGSRWRVARQLFTEGLLLAMLGATGGVVLATWANSLLLGAIGSAIGSVMPAALNLDARPDAFVLAMTLGTAVVCTLAFSFGPAWRMMKTDPVTALKGQAGESRQVRRRWTTGMLVTGQIALSLTLLTLAGLFVRMSVAAADSDPGFSLDRGVLIEIDTSLAGYDHQRALVEYQQVLERLRGLPRVEAASLGSIVPFGTTSIGRNVQRPGAPIRRGDPEADAGLVETIWTSVGAEYFAGFGLSMVAGREFTEVEERDPGAQLAIIDAALATRLFGTESPIGRQIQTAGLTPDAPPVLLQVVGLAPPIRHQLFDAEPGAHLYTPFGQNVPPTAIVHLRTNLPTAEDETAMLASLRQEIRALNASLPIVSLETMPMFRDRSLLLAVLRMGASTFIGFGVIALFLATIGVYGVKAYLVASRRREIGIRIALGAKPADVLWMVLREGVGIAAVGVAIGTLLSLAASSTVQGVIIQGPTFDPLVFGAAASLLVAAVLLASWMPARRATRVQPTTVLRA